MDPVSAFLDQYQRHDSELLGADELKTPALFDGEREFIEFADRDYRTDKHAAFEIRPAECALLLVDMQEDFVNPGNPMCIPEAYRQVPRMQRLIESCRSAKVPVYYTEHTIAPDVAHDFYEYWPPIKAGAIAEGKPGSQLYREFKPIEGERVISAKHNYDSFAGTDLDYSLRNRGVRTLIITGTLTNFCCESTARTGYFLGYHIVFGSDVNATDNALAQEATLRTLRRGFARIIDHHQIMNALSDRDTQHHDAIAARRTYSKNIWDGFVVGQRECHPQLRRAPFDRFRSITVQSQTRRLEGFELVRRLGVEPLVVDDEIVMRSECGCFVDVNFPEPDGVSSGPCLAEFPETGGWDGGDHGEPARSVGVWAQDGQHVTVCEHAATGVTGVEHVGWMPACYAPVGSHPAKPVWVQPCGDSAGVQVHSPG